MIGTTKKAGFALWTWQVFKTNSSSLGILKYFLEETLPPPLLTPSYKGSLTCSSLENSKYCFVLADNLGLLRLLEIRYRLKFLSPQVCSLLGQDLISFWLSLSSTWHTSGLWKCLCTFCTKNLLEFRLNPTQPPCSIPDICFFYS